MEFLSLNLKKKKKNYGEFEYNRAREFCFEKACEKIVPSNRDLFHRKSNKNLRRRKGAFKISINKVVVVLS